MKAFYALSLVPYYFSAGWSNSNEQLHLQLLKILFPTFLSFLLFSSVLFCLPLLCFLFPSFRILCFAFYLLPFPLCFFLFFSSSLPFFSFIFQSFNLLSFRFASFPFLSFLFLSSRLFSFLFPLFPWLSSPLLCLPLMSWLNPTVCMTSQMKANEKYVRVVLLVFEYFIDK